MSAAARALCAVLLAALSAPAQATYAVFIGISEYTRPGIPQLVSAHQDARRLYELLAGRRGFSSQRLHLLVSPESARNGEIKNTLQYVLSRAGPADAVLLFATAHGVQELDEEGFIIPRDGDLDDRRWGVYRLSLLDGLLRQTRAGLVLLFLDLCHARFQGPNLINAAVEKLVAGWPAVFGVLASRPGQLAISRPPSAVAGAPPGLFAAAVAEALRGAADADGNGVVDVMELAWFVSDRVRAATRNAQQPVILGRPDRTRPVLPGVPVSSGFPRWPQPLAALAAARLALLAPPLLQVARQQAFDQSFARALSQGRLLGPGGALELLEQHEALLAPQQLLEAQGRLAAALEDEGQQVISWYAAGEEFASEYAAVQRAEFARAEALFTAAVRLRSATPASEWRDLDARRQFCAGRRLTFDGQFAAAETALRRAIAIDPEAAQPHNALGVAYLATGRYDPAALQFQEARRLAPAWGLPPFNLALGSAERGDYTGAIQLYRSAIQRAPQYPYLSYNLALLLQRLNRHREALERYRAAFDAYTVQARAYRERADRWQVSDPDEAERARRRAAIMDRNRADVRNAIGSLREARGERRQAAREYEAALALDPDLLVARHNLGLLLARDHPERAVLQWEENLRRNPAFLPSRISLAETRLRLGEFAAAAGQYRQARALVAARGQDLALGTALDFARALAGAGDAAGALEQVRAALARAPGSVAARELAGDLLACSDRFAEAYAHYTAALRLVRDLRGRSRLRRKLEGTATAGPGFCPAP